jgi:hypothetical protein
MLFLGHIAAALVLADLTKSDRKAAVAGNLLPDVVDKTGGWVLRTMLDARWLAHGLPFTGAACLAARFFVGGSSWRGFVVGYLGHLVGDLYGGGKVPWFAPFEKPNPQPKLWQSGSRFRREMGKALAPEVVGAGVIWLLLRRNRSV